MITATQADFDQIRSLTKARKSPALVSVPPCQFLMVDGEGYPNDNPAYAAAVEALFTLSYTIKFALKREHGTDYKVGPLEGLWWADDMDTFRAGTHQGWKWTAMISQPSVVTNDVLEQASSEVRRRKPGVDVDAVRKEIFAEGECAQLLYVGPYSDEGSTIVSLHEFIRESGHELRGKHHEIYLSDPRRTAQEKLKTVIRQPVAKVNPA